jgi:CRP-like cAMP-binding protein
MEYSEVQRILNDCADLRGLNECASAALFWRGEEQTLSEGQVIYKEGEKLDGTFCLLLSGDVIIEKGGTIIGGIWEQQIFGEMAYFTRQQVRTATVRVGSTEAVIVKFHLNREELGCEPFSTLKRYLGLHTWGRFVSTSQTFA